MNSGSYSPPNNSRNSVHPEAYRHSSVTFPPQLITTSNSSSIAGRIVKLAVAVLVLTLGIGLALLAYVLTSKVSWTSSEVITAVPQGNVLLITATASKFILTCVPLIMGLAAYSVAHVWLDASNRRQKLGVPTPYQYVLLLGLFQGASPIELWRTLRYLVRGTGRRSRASYPLIYTFIILFIALVLAYLLVGLDFALHSLSTTRLVSAIGAQIDVSTLATSDLHGMEFKSDCNALDGNSNACTIQLISGSRQPAEFREGSRILAGLSSNHRISYTSPSLGQDTRVAILTPALQPTDKSFSARTTAVSTICSPISSSCDLQTPCDASYHYPLTNLPLGIGNASAELWWSTCSAFACAPPSWPKYWLRFRNDTVVVFSEPLEQRGENEMVDQQAAMDPAFASVNPFRIIVNVASYLDASILDDVCAQKTEDGKECIKGKDEGYLYSGGANPRMGRSPSVRYTLLGCTMSILDVDYTYLNRTYTINSSNLSTQATTQALSSVLYTENGLRGGRGRQMSNWLMTFAASGASSKELAGKLSEEIGRSMLGLGHAAFDSSLPVTRATTAHEVLATVIPTWTLGAFIAGLGVFALLGIVLAGLAMTADKTAIVVKRSGPPGSTGVGEDPVANVIDIARRRLCEPTGLVYELFEKDADTAGIRWMADGEKMFDESPIAVGSGPEQIKRRTVRVGLLDDGFGFHK
ncbi:hypothetical protein PIIN_08127 [Serendipita indica DSM 11827]|uniref:Uncharacterized protein n=1 Tax=Serendipita indica (strain DSM 11827) TaxID=1109443 RepID=G4TS81_SERID|nr:hypothetical protein PIIN_08127 [Serendipita indica DSM 11827]